MNKKPVKKVVAKKSPPKKTRLDRIELKLIESNDLMTLVVNRLSRIKDEDTRLARRVDAQFDHLFEKVTSVLRQMSEKQNRELHENSLDWGDIINNQLKRIADDSIRIEQAMNRVINMLDNIVFTPEVRQGIINKIKCTP